MQSLSKSHAAALGQVHLFIEGSDSEVLMQLRELALLITPNVHEVSGADRLKLHVASVFASNFSNHMYSLAAEVLAEAGIPFEALLPLIKSTSSMPCHRHSRRRARQHVATKASWPST